MRIQLTTVWLALLLFMSGFAIAQSSESPVRIQAPAPKPQFFAGIVTGMADNKITVSRTLIGRAPETRVFVINGDTKLNRSALKAKSRVTVRYQHMPDGDVALEIQIHRSRPS